MMTRHPNDSPVKRAADPGQLKQAAIDRSQSQTATTPASAVQPDKAALPAQPEAQPNTAATPRVNPASGFPGAADSDSLSPVKANSTTAAATKTRKPKPTTSAGRQPKSGNKTGK